MPVPELQEFRNQYPQYADLPDGELAASLAQKYPAYSDLPGKVRADKPSMLSKVGAALSPYVDQLKSHFSAEPAHEFSPSGEDVARVASGVAQDPNMRAVAQSFPDALRVIPEVAHRIVKPAVPFMGGKVLPDVVTVPLEAAATELRKIDPRAANLLEAGLMTAGGMHGQVGAAVEQLGNIPKYKNIIHPARFASEPESARFAGARDVTPAAPQGLPAPAPTPMQNAQIVSPGLTKAAAERVAAKASIPPVEAPTPDFYAQAVALGEKEGILPSIGMIQRRLRVPYDQAVAINARLKAEQSATPVPESAIASGNRIEQLPPEPKFVDTMRQDISAATVPDALSASEVVAKIESEQNPEFFDKNKITKQVEKGGETYVKVEVDPNELTVRKGVEPGVSVAEKGPIIVGDKGKVIDGNHRTVDAIEAGEKTIEAYVPVDSELAAKAAVNPIDEMQRLEGEVSRIWEGREKGADLLPGVLDEIKPIRAQIEELRKSVEQPRAEIPIPERFQQTQPTEPLATKPLRTHQGEIGDAVERNIEQVTNSLGNLEYRGKEYEGAIREGKKLRLKDHPDKVISNPAEMLKVEEKVPFDVPGETPMFEQTAAGMQAVIPGAEARSVPDAPLRAKHAQTEKPLGLEQPGIQAKEPGLFAETKPVPSKNLSSEELAAADEMRAELNPREAAKAKGAARLKKAREVRAEGEAQPVSTKPSGGSGSYGYPQSGTPAFISRQRKQELADLGHSREAISKMSPAEADKIIKGQTKADDGVQGFPEFRKTAKDVPQTVSPLERGYQPPAPAGEQPLTRRGDIIRDLQEAFQVPIRTGHGNFAAMKAAGFFKVKEEVIRLRKANDMEVAAHEIGHFLSKKFFGRKAARLPGNKELVQLGQDLYGSRKPNGGYAEEGFAEFIRLYVTSPNEIAARAPTFSQYFDAQLEAKLPDVRDTLQKARADWTRYQEQPAVARLLSQVSIGEDKPWSITWDGIYKSALDDLTPIKTFTDRMNQGKAPLRASDNPYTLARLFRGWIGKADLFLKDGPIDFDTLRPVPGAKPLNEILAPFSKNLDDLRAYLVARRAAELMTRGKETGISASDVQATLDTYNHLPQFVQAAEDLRTYNNALLDYLVKSGVLGEEGAAKIKELNQDYVPFYRLIEGDTKSAGMAGTQKFANLGSPVKKIKGSAREIIDPLESIVKNTYAMINVAERNQVGQALVRLAKSGEGFGKYLEEVPRDKIPVTLKDEELNRILQKYGRIKETESFKTSKKEFTKEIGVGEGAAPGSKVMAATEERVREALVNRGFNEGEAKVLVERLKSAKTETVINSVIEKIITEQTIKTVTKELELDLPPEVIAAFRPDPKVPGMDNVISVRQDGKPILYQVHPELYEAMAGLGQNASNMLIKILSLPARALRLGATTLSPEFAVRNPVRDQWSAAIYSQYGFVPGVDLIRGLAHVIKNDELYQAWKAGGGEGSMLVSMDRTSLQKNLKDVIKSGQAKNLASTVIRHPIESLRMLSELGEAATRVGEFAKGISKEGGLEKENILKAAMASREVTLDFARMGSTMKATGANQVIAFLNSNLQGLDKMARAFSDKETRNRTFAKAIATITIPSLMLYVANSDDPRYQELPNWQRDLFWIVPTGHMDTETWSKMTPKEKAEFNAEHAIWRIPKPFELGILFGTLPERMFDWVLKNDPRAMAEFAKSALSTLPNPIPTGAIPLIENMANWSMFRERRIVPRSKEDVAPEYQYSGGTSEAAKALGGAVSYSPAKIENLIQGWFGAAGKLSLDVADTVLPSKIKGEKPESTTADIPVVRAFAVRSPGQPQSVERFYELYGKSLEAKATYDNLKRERKMDEAQQYLKDNRQAIADARTLAPIAKTFGVLHKRVDMITNSDKSAADKRLEIDAMTFKIAEIANRVLKHKADKNAPADDGETETDRAVNE